MKVSTGRPCCRQTSKSFSVCGSTPLAASSTITTLSTASSVRKVSSLKSWWPGVSSSVTWWPSSSNSSAAALMEMPRCCSISIQSETAWRCVLLPRTAPASSIAPA